MQVEAQSLASIRDLAFNPPSRCDATTHHPIVPALTLYIVRVPGSRDVFLTPLKPRDRVVNAQDVQSSLYFLHVDGNDDEEQVRDASPSSLQTPRPDLEIPRSINRKPVAASKARKPLPTPPASPEKEQAPWTSPIAQNGSVPLRKPILPKKSPDRERLRRPISSIPSDDDLPPVSVEEPLSCSTLTLIRRDPTSGQQWNIAKIKDPTVEEVSSEAFKENHSFGRRVKTSGAPLYIEVYNPGYLQFSDPRCHARSKADLDFVSPTDVKPMKDYTLQRRLWMDGSRFADHSYANRRPSSLASSDSARPLSLASTARSTRPSLSSQLTNPHSKGYAFEDLWGNKCEFVTAATGKSLRCRQVRHDAGIHEGPHRVEVSELRFNLPSHHFHSKSDTACNSDTNSRRNTYLSAPRVNDSGSVRSDHSRHSVSDDGTVDYSLGRERAGGGFAGRETKLGKLIVEEMGMKMLDLVVATNLALWWRAYERCS